MKTFATRIMEKAIKHYNDGGWDVIVECWEPEDIERILAEHNGDEDEATKTIEALVDIWSDRQADARNSAF
jgi:hypothetical protein